MKEVLNQHLNSTFLKEFPNFFLENTQLKKILLVSLSQLSQEHVGALHPFFKG